MLKRLLLRNLAIIEQAELSFAPGLNVITGETGAGKSILLDGLNLALGSRADTDIIRHGESTALVEAEFVIPSLPPALADLLSSQQLPSSQASLLLSRTVRRNSASVARVGGEPIKAGTLKEIGKYLVDIHGQTEHFSLLDPKSHLGLLDSFAAHDHLLSETATGAIELRRVESQIADLIAKRDQTAEREDYVSFQIVEIDQANLVIGQDDELRRERKLLANAEKVIETLRNAFEALEGSPFGQDGISSLTGSLRKTLDRLARLDPAQSALAERSTALESEIESFLLDLRQYQGATTLEPGRVEIVEDRLALIGRIARKHGGSIASALVHRDQFQQELEELGSVEFALEQLTDSERLARLALTSSAIALSASRKASAKLLENRVGELLQELSMEGSTFQISFSTQASQTGIQMSENRSFVQVDETGFDNVRFMLSANPGEPPLPVDKVASGGETSRIMLALKAALAQADKIPTLVFDEIDQGIGGRVGAIVGSKLRDLARDGNRQVIVVTHLPQLAAYADNHIAISKSTTDRTRTVVKHLDRSDVKLELASMFGTSKPESLAAADAALQAANTQTRLNIR